MYSASLFINDFFMTTIYNPFLQPFLKWAWGKRQLLWEMKKYIPKKFKNYHEPFLGAWALFFELQLKKQKVFVNDINEELINCYLVIKDDVEELITLLKKYKNTKEEFYKERVKDRDTKVFDRMTPIQKAARIIYLNKTCYNGLFRVNSQWFFNTPFGYYKNPNIVNEGVLRAASIYFQNKNITFLNNSFEIVLKYAKKGDFVYFDPPYDPVSNTASFTGYNLDQFYKDDQKKLNDVYKQLDERWCYVLLSNSATNFIKELYRGFKISTIKAKRNINSNWAKRQWIDEVLIYNYDI